MRTKIVVLMATLLASISLVATENALAQTSVAEPTKPRPAKAYIGLPMSFEANRGQTDSRVRFISRGDGYCLFLTSTGAILTLRSPDEQASVLRMELLGAGRASEIAGVDELPGKANYFVGSDPQKWRTNIPTYGKVAYRQVYRGIDLIYYGSDQQLEYDFIVSPGASPRVIRLSLEGAWRVRIDAEGNLVLATPSGELRQHRPLIFQLESDGSRREISGSYRLVGPRTVGFDVAAYDESKPLFIDPVLTYSTYLGGSNADSGRAIAVDGAGNIYVAGLTVSSNFPVVAAAQPQMGSASFGDAFVAKLSADGKTLVYSTYLGGSTGDIAYGIAVDAEGNALVVGVADSSNFPLVKAFQPSSGGVDDAFVAKLGPTGSTLHYSSFLGGIGSDIALAVAVDADGNAYVAGQTSSPDFPVTAGVVQPACANVICSDAFITKVSAEGALSFSTFLGGTNSETAGGIALDAAGDIYVTGSTNSPNFPVTAGAFQTTCNRCDVFYYDVFVTKMDPTASALLYSTFLGGRLDDFGNGIAVDSAGNAYVTGEAQSPDFDVTKGALQPFGGFDAFVTKVNSSGTALAYSTYLGGSVRDEGRGIAVDAGGNAYVTGSTLSTDFPTVDPIQPAHGGNGSNDAFVAQVNSTGTALLFSTFLGGLSSDSGMRIAVDASSSIYVVGETFATNFPATPSALQKANAGSGDAFVVRIGTEMPAINPGGVVNAASFAPGAAVAPGSIAAAIGQNLASSTASATGAPLPTTLGGATMAFNASQAVPKFFASASQVNLQVPWELEGQAGASLTDTVSGMLSGGEMVSLAAHAPGIFTTTQTGNGQGAILIANTATFAAPVGSIPGAASQPARRGVDFLEIYCTGLGPVTNRPATGDMAVANPLSTTTTTPHVTVGGVRAKVLFSGLAPNFVGLYVVTVHVPAGAPTGDAVAVVLALGGQASNTVTIAVR